VEDQKELASPVSPELRQKEVQMNFLNQLTSVFNPRTVVSSPISPQALVSCFSHIPSFHGVFFKDNKTTLFEKGLEGGEGEWKYNGGDELVQSTLYTCMELHNEIPSC
jgi:hypothetical protein